jgi:hypothetical protein
MGWRCYQCGKSLTFKLLTPCNQVIFRTVIQSALDPTLLHKRHTPLGGEKDANHADDKIFVCSNKSSSNNPKDSQSMLTIDPKDLIGRTFLKETEADGQRFRAPIVRTMLS